MTRLIFFTSLMLIATSLRCQNAGGYLSFSAGPVFPLGKFHATNIDDPEAGFAQVGFNIHGLFGYKLGKAGGFCIFLDYQSNGVNARALVSEYKRKYPAYEWYASTEPWENKMYMAGYFNSVPLSQNVHIDVFACAGLSTSLSSAILMRASGPAYNNFSYGNDKSKTVAYLGGIGLRLDLTNNISLLIQPTFMYCKPVYTNRYASGPYTQKMTNLAANIGVAFRF